MADPFQPRFVDLVRNITATQGTGNIVLGSAASGFTSFATAVAAGESFYYSVIGIDKPAEREVGRGTMQPDGTISREAISGSLTSFTAGNKTISLIAAAEWFEQVQSASVSGGSGGNDGVATRAALATRASQLSPAILAEAGREGLFAFDSSNLSTEVAADTAQGLFVAPSTAPSGASGAWVRRFSGPVNVKWFGATGDGATDDSQAFLKALALLKAIAGNDSVYYKGSPTLFIPAGLYNLGTTTLDITHTLVIEGESALNGYSSRLKWADNTTGIRIQAYNTNGASGTDPAPYHYSGSYTTIRNLGLEGGVSGTESGLTGGEAEYHGIHARSNVVIEDVRIDGFRGDGVHAKCELGAVGFEGNSNVSFINRLSVSNVRNGVFLDGADANAWTLIGVNGVYCRQHTVWDSSFLGNTHIGHHSANAGLVPGVPASVVSYNGNRYCVRMGQAAGASTNAPSGTTADNAWWYYISAGAAAAYLNIPLWTSGVSVREGGGYKADSTNAYNSFIGLYSEGGEGFSQFVSPSVVTGGLIEPKTTGNQYGGNELVAPNPVTLGRTRGAFGSGGQNGATAPLTVHNSAALASTTYAKLDFAQGFEADGATPCVQASIASYGVSADPATASGNLVFSTRQYLTGAMTERMVLDLGNDTFRPYTTNALELGLAGFRWKKVSAVAGDFSGALTASNLTGTNTGDQTITLTGDVTGSGTGSFAATIGANKVTFAKFVAATGASIVGATAAGNFAELTPASARSVLGLASVATSGSASDLTTGTIPVAQTPAFSGDVTKASGSGSLTIGSGAVTYAKLQNVSGNGLLLGRASAGAGVVEEVSLANGLAISGTALGLGAITPSSLVTGGAITSSGTAGNGYSTGAGGAVTQATSKSTGVTLNKICGRVTMNAASLAASTSVSFTLTNSTIAATDVVVVNIASAGSTNAYFIGVDAVAAGSCRIHLRNMSAGALAEALVLNFAVTKSVIA